MPALLYWHAGLMIAGCAAMTAGISMAVSMRHRPWWLKTHKYLAFVTLSATLLGLISAVTMVFIFQGKHLAVPHAYLGVLIVFLAAATSLFGLLQFKVKRRRASVRLIHRVCGFLLFILMISNIISGFFLAGII